MDRENWPDIAKGIAIILVVLGHCLNHFDDAVLHRICEIIYLFHMPLFVTLSGYSFFWVVSHNSFARNISNNVCIYVIQSVVYISFNILMQRIISTSNVYSARDFLTFPVIPVAHFWYIQAIIIYYFIFFLYERFVASIRIRRVLEALTVIIIFPLNRLICSETLTRICYHFLFFAIGYFLHLILNNRKNRTGDGSLCGKGSARSSSVLSFLGRNSLWIYIFHPYVTAAVKAALGFFHIGNQYTGLIIMVTAAIILPLILRFVMNKTHTAWMVTNPINAFRGTE